jgi:hypothetical protein
MKTIKQLEQLCDGMVARGERDALETLARFLDQLAHDLNNPLATFGLELFSLGAVADRLPEAIATNDLGAVAGNAKTLCAIRDNLEAAHRCARDLLEAVQTRCDDFAGDGDAAREACNG